MISNVQLFYTHTSAIEQIGKILIQLGKSCVDEDLPKTFFKC
jgi:hypothetical protein